METSSPSPRRGAWLAFVAFAWIASTASAANLPALPLYGGDVRALRFDPGDPERVFAGTAAGQLYRSDDGGATWREAGATVPFPNWVVGSLHFDRHRPGRLWAGLRGLWGGGGVAFSDDAGAHWTWRTADGLAAEPVHEIVSAPAAPDRLYVAARGGVWRSDDAGASWRKVSAGVPGLTQVASLAVDVAAPERLLAGTWRRAFRSDDGGASWRGVFAGMVLDTEVFQLLASPHAGDGVWAATCGWVYRGEAFGASWRRVQAGFVERRTRAIEMLSPTRLVAGTVAGAYLSDDGGESFRRAREPGLSIVALAHHPARPERVLAATDGAGVWRSLDGGESYALASQGLAALRVSAAVGSGGTLYVAVPWAGPLSGVYRSLDGGVHFERLDPGLAAPLALAIAEGQLFVLADGRLRVRDGERWRDVAGDDDGSVEGLPSSARPALRGAAASLPAGSVLAVTELDGRVLLATAGFGLRWAEPASVALEAGQDPQIGGEPLGRDR